MAWLPHVEKISKISLFVLAQLTNVTDGQTDRRTVRRTPRAGILRLCIASRGKNLCHFGPYNPGALGSAEDHKTR